MKNILIYFLSKVLIIRRIKDGIFATKYFNKKYFQIIKWMVNSKEDTNFTYDLKEENLNELYKLLEIIFDENFEQIKKYSEELLNFSINNERNFALFKEKPKNHWYPGAGIGISFIKK